MPYLSMSNIITVSRNYSQRYIPPPDEKPLPLAPAEKPQSQHQDSLVNCPNLYNASHHATALPESPNPGSPNRRLAVAAYEARRAD